MLSPQLSQGTCQRKAQRKTNGLPGSKLWEASAGICSFIALVNRAIHLQLIGFFVSVGLLTKAYTAVQL